MEESLRGFEVYGGTIHGLKVSEEERQNEEPGVCEVIWDVGNKKKV